MARFFLFSLFLIMLTLSAAAVFAIEEEDSGELLIEQVVSEGGEEEVLTVEHHFSLFKSKFGKSYATQEEHDYRLSVFRRNLRQAKRHQMLDPTAVHGVTKFSDLTPDEFQHNYLGMNSHEKLTQISLLSGLPLSCSSPSSTSSSSSFFPPPSSFSTGILYLQTGQDPCIPNHFST